MRRWTWRRRVATYVRERLSQRALPLLSSLPHAASHSVRVR